MFKAIVLLSRLPFVSREEFADYYEKNHQKLISSLYPTLIGYKRNHVLTSSVTTVSEGEELPFDSITEIAFEDEAAWKAWRAEATKPETVAIVRGDEAHFLDYTKSKLFVVNEQITFWPAEGAKPRKS